jgi:hypothetical protein
MHQNVVKSHVNSNAAAELIAVLPFYQLFMHKRAIQKRSAINLMIEAFVPIANGFSGFALH